uniref:8.9 kDa family member n=1 Tax=Rhipicephalus zambeziensis TaxID=60191 RepID=A0A224YAL4_9ACAR
MIKYTVSVLVSMILVVASQTVNDCDKTTLLVGNGMCTEGPVPIAPNQVMQLRCPCANVTCHDHMRRVTVTWSDCDTVSWNAPVNLRAHGLPGTTQRVSTQEESGKKCSKRAAPGSE